MRKLAPIIMIGLCAGLLAAKVEARQLTFTKQATDQQFTFNYQWQDKAQQAHELALALPKEQVNRQVHKRFMPALAQRYVYVELHKAARKIDPREAHVTIKRRGQDIQINTTSRSEQLLNKWQRQMQISKHEAFERYLSENYYAHFQTYLGQQGVKPDHLRYVRENRAALLPVAQAIYDKVPLDSDVRDYLNLLLSWVQSIPYDKLENRLTSNGAGYSPPLSVIAENRGDCDSKAVLVATLLSGLLPDIELIMLYLPNHALLGINLPLRGNEQTYHIGGKDYLLMEPTGPALMQLGEVGAATEQAINSGMYTHESLTLR